MSDYETERGAGSVFSSSEVVVMRVEGCSGLACLRHRHIAIIRCGELVHGVDAVRQFGTDGQMNGQRKPIKWVGKGKDTVDGTGNWWGPSGLQFWCCFVFTLNNGLLALC